jgi:hypothetical protein
MSEDKQAELPLVVTTAPKRIYLQVSDDAFDNGNPFPPNWQDATWCHESVVDCEVEYIRADLADTPSSAGPVKWGLWMDFDGVMRPTDPVFSSQEDAEEQQRKYGGQIVPLYTHPPALRDKFPITNEELADLYKKASGKQYHASDCATSIAPAEVPGPCDCDAPALRELSDADILRILAENNVGYANEFGITPFGANEDIGQDYIRAIRAILSAARKP